MSLTVIGLALGLSASAAPAVPDVNPHMLAADRQYQDLIYQNRRIVAVPSTRSKRVAFEGNQNQLILKADTGTAPAIQQR